MCNNLGRSSLFFSSEFSEIAFCVAPAIPLLVDLAFFKLFEGFRGSNPTGSPSGLLSSTSEEDDMVSWGLKNHAVILL
eukprot:768187-Hanusia_phi.AAC.3